MICLLDTRSRLSIATIVFYTCIWIPITEIKQMILELVSSILSAFHEPRKGNDQNESLSPMVVDLPAAKFVESAKHHREDVGDDGLSAAASCSICLVEYESEDMVTRLPRCGHVFHIDCIKRWLDRNQFTCPLCRDHLLHVKLCHAREKEEISGRI